MQVSLYCVRTLKFRVNSLAGWFKPGNPAPKRLRQEDHELEAILGYRVRPCFTTSEGTVITLIVMTGTRYEVLP
jgi:hypothetical protein